MSNAPEHVSTAADAMVRETRDMVIQAAQETAEQLTLLPDMDAILSAREQLGESAGNLTTIRKAGEIMRARGGRPAGARNRRTDDFRKYISKFGQHPAVTLMQIQSMPPLELIELSLEIDPSKRRMTLHEAMSLKARCAETLLPYMESKQPVAVDMTFNHLPDLIIEGLTHTSYDVRTILDAEPLPFDDDESDDE